MDENGIDMALLSPGIPCCSFLPGDLSSEGARIVNDALQEAAEKYKGRYKNIGFLPWNLPGKAIEEAQRLKKEGFVGVMLCSQIGDEQADRPVYRPIYKELANLGLTIFLHPDVPVWGKYISGIGMIPMMSFPVTESFCLMRLILSGIVEENPKLRIVIPHCGGILPALSGRIWNYTENKKNAMDNITIPPVKILKSDQIWYDTVSPYSAYMKFVANFLGGTDRLMFGTDSPWVDMPVLMGQINEAFPDAGDRENVYGGAAQKLLSL